MTSQPSPGVDVVAPAAPFEVEIGQPGGQNGTVIGMQFTGNAMNYLVVLTGEDEAPTWFPEQEVSRAYFAS